MITMPFVHIYSHTEEGHNLVQPYGLRIFTYDDVLIHCGTFVEFLEILVIFLVKTDFLYIDIEYLLWVVYQALGVS